MKKKFTKPSVQMLQLQPEAILLEGSNWSSIEPGQPNVPAGTREYGTETGSGSTGGSIWDKGW